MGSVPKPETERNLNLINDYLEIKPEGGFKYTIAQLGLKYARTDESGNIMPLTATRIHQILKKHSIDKNRVVRKVTNN